MRLWSKLAPLALAFGLAYAPTHAAVVITEGVATSNIPGLTGFTTTGAMMDGLSVTATFASGFSETLLWADIDADGGGVSGTGGWALRLDGDTFTAPWNFTGRQTVVGGPDPLTRLVLNGLNALTVFDRTFGGAEGTPGSALGTDFACTGAPNICLDPRIVRVLYDFEVSVGGAAPVGDLWQTVSIDFCTTGAGPCTPNAVTGNWSFVQDTDNDSRIFIRVPEPGSLALVGLALSAAAWFSRRRRNAI